MCVFSYYIQIAWNCSFGHQIRFCLIWLSKCGLTKFVNPEIFSTRQKVKHPKSNIYTCIKYPKYTRDIRCHIPFYLIQMKNKIWASKFCAWLNPHVVCSMFYTRFSRCGLNKKIPRRFFDSDAVICAILGVELDQAKQSKGFMVSILNVNGKFDMKLFWFSIAPSFSFKSLTFFHPIFRLRCQNAFNE